MDKETLIKLAQPAATALLALSVMTLPITVKAYGDNVTVSGTVTVTEGSGYLDIRCASGCNWLI